MPKVRGRTARAASTEGSVNQCVCYNQVMGLVAVALMAGATASNSPGPTVHGLRHADRA
jgi:hypothetical protein